MPQHTEDAVRAPFLQHAVAGSSCHGRSAPPPRGKAPLRPRSYPTRRLRRFHGQHWSPPCSGPGVHADIAKTDGPPDLEPGRCASTMCARLRRMDSDARLRWHVRCSSGTARTLAAPLVVRPTRVEGTDDMASTRSMRKGRCLPSMIAPLLRRCCAVQAKLAATLSNGRKAAWSILPLLD